MIRLLYIGMRYDYGDPRRGDCFEYVQFHDTLSRMPGVSLSFFPYDVVLREKGRKEMIRLLRRNVEEAEPDLCLFALFTDEIDEETITWVTEKSGARTVNWFADDHWRFEYYSRHWAPLFHFVATTDSAAVEKYHAIGIRNVLKTQWGFNHHRYRRVVVPRQYDVTFVGQVHSRRRQTVELLRKQGIDVRCWGRGWEGGNSAEDRGTPISPVGIERIGWCPVMPREIGSAHLLVVVPILGCRRLTSLRHHEGLLRDDIDDQDTHRNEKKAHEQLHREGVIHE